jgi:hypothetical protein
VFPAVRGKGELAVALFIYRQHAVQKSWTVVVTNIRLMTEMGMMAAAARMRVPAATTPP